MGYYPPLDYKDAYGPGWSIFIVMNYIVWFIILAATVRKLYQINGGFKYVFNKNFNKNVGNLILLGVVIGSLSLILYFIDPMGFEAILPAVVNAILLRLAQVIVVGVYLFLIIFWQQLETGQLTTRRQVVIPVYIFVGLLFIIIMPISIIGAALNFPILSSIVGLIFTIYLFVMMIFGAKYAYKLVHYLKGVDRELAQRVSETAPYIKKITRLSISATLIAFSVIVFVIWQVARIENSTTELISNVVLDIFEVLAYLVAYYSVSPNLKIEVPQQKSVSTDILGTVANSSPLDINTNDNNNNLYNSDSTSGSPPPGFNVLKQQKSGLEIPEIEGESLEAVLEAGRMDKE